MKTGLNIFIKRTFIFATGSVVFTLFFCFLWFKYYSYPVPNLSNSISLNAKAHFVKKKYYIEDPKIIALGSSMTLNNLNSDILINYFGSNKYLNASSWGLKISDIYKLLKIYNQEYTPHTIIISSNLMDFYRGNQNINFNNLSKYLKENSLNVYIEHWNFKRMIKDSRLLGLYKDNETNYTSLKYDDFGGVNFPLNGFNINSKRWNGREVNSEVFDELQYSYLDSISKFCDIRNIKLLFVQSPFRKGYHSTLTNYELTVINNHVSRVNSILNKNQTIFINTLNNAWEDFLFVDYSHFSKEGSKIYTSFILAELEKR